MKTLYTYPSNQQLGTDLCPAEENFDYELKER